MKINDSREKVIIIKKNQDIGRILLGIAAILFVITLIIVLLIVCQSWYTILPAFLVGMFFG